MGEERGVDAFLSSGKRHIGPFHLTEPLGKGGFAPVWRAMETYEGDKFRDVAVKLFTIPAATTGDASASASRKAVLEEARALCRVEHPNVARFYTFTQDEDAGVFGLVMEYVRGTSVDKLIADEGKLDAARTIAIGLAVSSALVAVHAVGVVHRDIKPANVMEAEGVFKLIDFGIASLAAGARAPASQHKTIVMDDLPLVTAKTSMSMVVPGVEAMAGTIGYSDPVCVAHARAANAASDLYSLGATLYECLTGQIPAAALNRARGVTGLSGEVLDGRASPPPVRELVPLAPEPLAELVDRLVAPDPTARPQSAREVHDALVAMSAKTRVASVAPPAKKSPPRGVAIALAALTIALVGGGVWYAARSARASTPYVIRRIDDDVDFRKWIPYTDTHAKTSPVIRHVHIEAERRSSDTIRFIDYAGTSSPLGLECTPKSADVTCAEATSVEPGRRMYEIKLAPAAFGKTATIDYDVVSYNIYSFSHDDNDLSHITRRFEVPADVYRVTMHFSNEHPWLWVNVISRLEGSTGEPEIKRIMNTAKSDTFEIELKGVPANLRYRFDIMLAVP